MQGYELTDFEWGIIAPLLPNKPRGVRRVDDRRVLNGIFWVLRTGAPWRVLPRDSARRRPATTDSSGGAKPGFGTASWRQSAKPMTRCSDDRQHLGARPSACRQRIKPPGSLYGPLARRIDDQDPCAHRRAWLALGTAADAGPGRATAHCCKTASTSEQPRVSRKSAVASSPSVSSLTDRSCSIG
jgi:transposase